MTILNNKEGNITAGLTFAEKKLGVDIKLTTKDDLELNNLQDFSLIAGVPNVAQATKIKLSTESNGNNIHPKIGVNYPIGSKSVDALSLRYDILRSLSQDSRLSNIGVKIEVNGNVYLVTINVTLLNTDIKVPLQFVAQNQ